MANTSFAIMAICCKSPLTVISSIFVLWQKFFYHFLEDFSAQFLRYFLWLYVYKRIV